jgi:hypothetical protein
MALTPMNQTNLANYIPTVWAKEVQAAVERNLVFGANVDRHYEKYATYGDTIVVPVLSNLAASPFNAAADINLTTTNETSVNISINQRFYAAYGVDDFTAKQDALSYFDKGKTKLAYAMAKKIDDTLAALVNSLGNSVGTEGSAISIDTIIEAYESLNENEAPETDRAWIFDPESITDLLKIDYFVRMDYVPESIHRRGFSGRQIFGAPVYMTNNLLTVNTSYHAATYFHKETWALVMQMQPKVKVERFPARLSDALVIEALWGVKEMRDGYGVWIKTRS